MTLRDELRQGIIEGHVVPHLQPIVDLRKGEIKGFELLARWNHSSLGVVSPADFIPIAEAEGWMPLLTEALLRKALQSWQKLPPDASLSINISPTQLRGHGLATMILAVAGEFLFPLERLTLEITESTLLEVHDEVAEAISCLKHAGCKLALDDFGTGYSSLTYLRALPFDILKIDQSFVRTMVTRREDRKIVGAVIGLGKSLGLKIVAEGIEERAQAEMLLSLGCEYGQGWLFGRPVSVDAVNLLQAPNSSKPSKSSTPIKSTIVCMEALPAQSYAQLAAVYNGAPIGLGYFDCNFSFVNLNHRLAAIHGLAIDEILGRTLRDIDPEQYVKAEQYFLRARAGETIENVEFERPRSLTGLPITYLASFQPALDEVGEVVGILLSITDISERKQIEIALNESHDHYLSMVELSPQIPWTMDADGRNLELSPKWNALTGLPVSQTWNLTLLNIVYPEDCRSTFMGLHNSVEAGIPIDVEFRTLGKGDVWHWVRLRGTPRQGANGQVSRWYGSVEIIDEQRKTLEELQESHAHLQRVLDALPVGVVIAEAPSGKIISRNPCAQRILAQDPMNFEQVSDYSKRVAYYRNGTRLRSEDFPLARALRSGETTEPDRVFYDMGQGKGRWLDLTGAPLRNSKGEIVGAVATLQEISKEGGTVNPLRSSGFKNDLGYRMTDRIHGLFGPAKWRAGLRDLKALSLRCMPSSEIRTVRNKIS